MRGLYCCECYAGALDPLAMLGYEVHTADASATLVGTGARPLATAAKIASACRIALRFRGPLLKPRRLEVAVLDIDRIALRFRGPLLKQDMLFDMVLEGSRYRPQI